MQRIFPTLNGWIRLSHFPSHSKYGFPKPPAFSGPDSLIIEVTLFPCTCSCHLILPFSLPVYIYTYIYIFIYLLFTFSISLLYIILSNNINFVYQIFLSKFLSSFLIKIFNIFNILKNKNTSTRKVPNQSPIKILVFGLGFVY